MPRLSIRWQISLLSMLLALIPFLGWSYWQDVKNALLNAQSRIQESEARVIANTLLATQPNIRALLAADEDAELQKYSLSAPAAKHPIRLDGYFGDWPPIDAQHDHQQNNFILWQANPHGYHETSFKLQLAQTDHHLYIALRVRDHERVYRDKSHLRLSDSDHIQFTYVNAQARLQRVIIPAESEGPLATYYTDAQWHYGKDQINPDTNELIPSHKTEIQGFWRKTDEGYAVEFRLPLTQMETRPTRLHFAVVDIDNQPEPSPQAIVATLPESIKDQLNPVTIHAQELQTVIDRLQNSYARLWILDKLGREWAYSERVSKPETGYLETTQDRAPSIPCIRKALAGDIEPVSQLRNSEGELSRLIVCYPIMEGADILGVVVIDESAKHVLATEEQRMRDIAIKIGGTIILLCVLLFTYALILAKRIARLSHETSRSIDHHGRIEKTRLKSSQHFPDEIGELSRSISTLLEKQHTYIRFLERIPETLRHEISNPLNKLRTSLENLIDEKQELANHPYIKKIDKGIDQINGLTHQLTEAANLEHAIQEEPLARINLIEFIDGYFSTLGPPLECKQWDNAPAYILAETSRLEQLLDKLVDNAISFCAQNGKVLIGIERTHQHISIMIENDGPLLPVDSTEDLFAPMVSTRSNGNIVHLGLGLHIAKLICDHHHAKLEGKNRRDGSGVVFSVTFKII